MTNNQQCISLHPSNRFTITYQHRPCPIAHKHHSQINIRGPSSRSTSLMFYILINIYIQITRTVPWPATPAFRPALCLRPITLYRNQPVCLWIRFVLQCIRSIPIQWCICDCEWAVVVSSISCHWLPTYCAGDSGHRLWECRRKFVNLILTICDRWVICFFFC